MARAALPHLKQGSCIINTGSVTGLKGSAKLLDYSATKGAIHAFTMSLASSLLEKGIRVNAVAPGPVWTPLNPADQSAEEIVEFGKQTDFKRAAQPEELSPAYVFLASPVFAATSPASCCRQVRLEHGGQVWVASGDYKVAPDPTCEPFEPVRCDVFITESTFGLPIYRWCPTRGVRRHQRLVGAQREPRARQRAGCYSFGKAQRVLSGVDPSIGPDHRARRGANRSTSLPRRRRGAARHALVTEVKDKRGPAGAGAVPPSARPAPGCAASATTARLRQRLDAAARRAPARRLRPRLRAVRPCRLARPAEAIAPPARSA
jgi:hypothetical protein